MSSKKEKATAVKVEDTVKDIQGTQDSNPVEVATAAPQAPIAEPQQVTVLSSADNFVSDLVKEAPKTIAEVEQSETKMHNILELPEECWALHKKKYRYRWLAKSRGLEAKLRTSIWAICTRDNSPYVKPHRFKAHGAIEQAGMILAFTTEEMGKKREEEPALKSRDLVNKYTKELPNNEAAGFYKPKDSGDADNSEGFEMDYKT